jgi:isoquinoline 1-oxidoreductase subunit beta
VRVERVVAAVDCGQVVNPDMLAAQVENGIVFGLSAALKGEITVDRGRVQQSNFHDYPVLRLNEMPQVEVHNLPSTAAPGGMGEPPVPAIAPGDQRNPRCDRESVCGGSRSERCSAIC